TWTKITISGISGAPNLYGIDAAGGAGGPAVAGGASGTIVTCTPNCAASGAAWTKGTTTNTASTLRAVNQVSNTSMMAVGDNGTVDWCTSSCNAAAGNWVPLYSGTEQQLNGVALPDANDAWAVGANGTIIATNNSAKAVVWSTA